MKKKLLVIILLVGLVLLSQNFGYSQDANRFPSPYPTWISNVSFTKIGVDNWAAGGAIISENKISTSPLTNPAALTVTKFGLYAESGKWSTSEWLEDIKINGNYVIPAFASLAFPFKKLTLCFGYMNYYQFQAKMRMMVRTIDQPEGTGEYIESKTNIRLNTFFSSVSYAPDEKISLGLTTGLNYLVQKDKIWKSTRDGDGFGLLLLAGILIKPFPKFSFGYNLKYLTVINYDMVLHEKEKLIDLDPDEYGNNEIILGELSNDRFPYIAKFPLVFETGFMYQPFPFLSLHAKVEMQKWSESSSYEGEDIFNYHLGSRFNVLKWLILSLGYFTQDQLFYFPKAKFYDQKFLSTGLRIHINNSISLSACILDSHLLKEKRFADKYFQTYVAAGVSYSR